MRQRSFHDRIGEDRSNLRNPVLRDADPRDLEYAADELRDRTMTLEEEDDRLPAKRLVAAIMGVAVLLAVGAIVFRSEIKALLGLL